MSTGPEDDRALRAITDDGAFRVVALRSTKAVQGAIQAQKATGDAARIFAELLTGSVLIRETMSPDLRVQCILQGEDRGLRMIADAHPGGLTRGLVQLPASGKVVLGESARLQVARSMHNGALQQGVVGVPEDGSISGALMQYMQISEQVVSIVAVGCSLDAAGEVQAAGGYILQLLPEVGEGPLMVMTERMKDFESMTSLLARGAGAPEELMREILWGMPYSLVGEDTVHFGCNCSVTRVTASLATLPRRDIQEFIDDGRLLEIGCDYCGREYQIAPEQLRGLLEQQ